MKGKQKTSGAEPTPALPLGELTPEYWDLLNEFHQIDNHAKANGAPPDLWEAIRLVGNPDVVIGHRPHESDLAKVVRTFWGLPEAERMRILNGWKNPAPEDRSTEEERKIVQTYGFHSFLTLRLLAGQETDAFFQEMASEYSAAVRLHIAVGTTYAEVKAAIEAFHETVSCDWDKLITDPQSYTPAPRRKPAPPVPIAPSITGAGIDHFYSQVKELTSRLGLPMASHEDGVLLPDLTVRTLYQVDVANDNGTVCMLLGPEFEPKKEAQDEE